MTAFSLPAATAKAPIPPKVKDFATATKKESSRKIFPAAPSGTIPFHGFPAAPWSWSGWKRKIFPCNLQAIHTYA